MSTILKTVDLVKQFPAVLANDRVSIELRPNEVVGILGENGAGKTTLMNMLYGLFHPTSGGIYINDKEVHFSSPRDAISAGLGMVHQHFMLVETLTVTENVILGSEPSSASIIDYKKARAEVKELSERYGFHIDPDERIINMSVGLQQRVEILKALYRKVRILILDEPTAVLTPNEVTEFLSIVERLVKEGTSVIIITHKLGEIKQITNRVYVMRQGKIVGERNTDDIDTRDMTRMMVGREVQLSKRLERPATPAPAAGKGKTAPALLDVRSVSVGSDRNLTAVDEISLQVNAGEIVAIAGVEGNGQAEFAEALIGLRKLEGGEIVYKGDDISRTSTRKRISQNIGHVPADRHKYGLVLSMHLFENVCLGYHRRAPFSKRHVLQQEKMIEYSSELAQKFDVRPPDVRNYASHLSGGNQQKLILAREFSRTPALLVISQPTRGLDVGAIEYIHEQIMGIRNAGAGAVLFSLELDEIFALADRILVMYRGKIVHETVPEKSTPQKLGIYMTGGSA